MKIYKLAQLLALLLGSVTVASATGNFNVEGGDLHVENNADIDGDLNVDGNLDIGGILSIENEVIVFRDGSAQYAANNRNAGNNIITNGYGNFYDNYNFTSFALDPNETVDIEGITSLHPSFRLDQHTFEAWAATNDDPSDDSTDFYGKKKEAFLDELIPVDPDITYKVEFYAKTDNFIPDSSNFNRMYVAIAPYDVDGRKMNAHFYNFKSGTVVELARDLVNGDTELYLKNTSQTSDTVALNASSTWDASGEGLTNTWEHSTKNHRRAIIFWNETNDYGVTYPPESYSRTVVQKLWANSSANLVATTGGNSINGSFMKINLRVAWSGGTIPAGTLASQGDSAAQYIYPLDGNYVNLPTTWDAYSGSFKIGSEIPGIAYFKLGFIVNFNNKPIDEKTYINSVHLSALPLASELLESLSELGPYGDISMGTFTD